MSFELKTRSGHNMYDMASLLQKAIRRNKPDLARYAAYELFGNYHTMLWNRMMVVSSEDCWGVITKEIISLRLRDEEQNKGKKYYDKDFRFVDKAVKLLCACKKNRDACYYSCNFVMLDDITPKIDYTIMKKDVKDDIESIAIENLEEKNLYANNLIRKDNQIDMLSMNDDNEKWNLANILYNSILRLRLEEVGYATLWLYRKYSDVLWRELLLISNEISDGKLNQEIIALHITDEKVNSKRPVEKRDMIFISKAIVILLYKISQKFNNLLGVESENYYTIDINPVEEDTTPLITMTYDEIPIWVYDVHTIRGKQMGKTDWRMNIDEQAGLTPLQLAFFDDASWEYRYEYKHRHNMLTEEEYQDHLQFRKGRVVNPIQPL